MRSCAHPAGGRAARYALREIHRVVEQVLRERRESLGIFTTGFVSEKIGSPEHPDVGMLRDQAGGLLVEGTYGLPMILRSAAIDDESDFDTT